MTEASDWLENLVAAFAVHAAGEVTASATSVSGRAATDTVALVALHKALDGASQDRLAAVLGLTQSGVTRLVNRLIREGLVMRQRGPDGRTVALALTAAGSEASQRIVGARAETSRTLLGRLDAAEQTQLAGLMSSMLGGLVEDGTDATRICRMCDLTVCHDIDQCPVTAAAARYRLAQHGVVERAELPPPAPVPAEHSISLMFDVFVVANRMGLLLGEALRPLGMSATEYALLSLLVVQGPLTATEVTRLIGMPPSTLTGWVHQLEGGGLLRRRVNPFDRRSRLLDLTPAGRARYDAALPWARAASEALQRNLAAAGESAVMKRAELRRTSTALQKSLDGLNTS